MTEDEQKIMKSTPEQLAATQGLSGNPGRAIEGRSDPDRAVNDNVREDEQ